MKSTLNTMDTYDCKDYSSIFNIPRIFVRKPQCHFGWDWAPKICAYGIIDEVSIEYKNRFEIINNKVVADAKGNLRFETLLNYDNKALKGPKDEVLKKGEPKSKRIIKISLALLCHFIASIYYFQNKKTYFIN